MDKNTVVMTDDTAVVVTGIAHVDPIENSLTVRDSDGEVYVKFNWAHVAFIYSERGIG